MSHGEEGLNLIFDHPSQFEEDFSRRAEFVKSQVAKAKASLILDQPFFGYILGQFTVVPVNQGIMSFAVDQSHIYVNTDYFEKIIKDHPNWKGKIKGILIHVLIHTIFRHHRRQKTHDPHLWGIATDIVVFTHLRDIRENWQMPKDWDVPLYEDIPDSLRNHSAEKTYQLLLEEIQEDHGDERGRRADTTEEDLETHPNLEQFSMVQVAALEENIGMQDRDCDLDQISLDVNQEQEDDDLEEQYFEGLLRTAYQRQKGFGSLPEGLDRFVQKRLAVKIDWQATLSRYLQNIIVHDLTWTRPNKRLFGQGYFFPGPLKENTTVMLALDTSGSIEDDLLSIFLSESQAILQSITNVTLIVVDCDAKVQQIRTYEYGEPINSHRFIGKGGTDFRPVFKILDEYQPDVLVYLTDGDGIFPPSAPDVPVLWVLTKRVKVPFGLSIFFDLN